MQATLAHLYFVHVFNIKVYIFINIQLIALRKIFIWEKVEINQFFYLIYCLYSLAAVSQYGAAQVYFVVARWLALCNGMGMRAYSAFLLVHFVPQPGSWDASLRSWSKCKTHTGLNWQRNLPAELPGRL